jgi:DNA-binding winged helix-turn-helix (wHTH) protein/TolB-like protein/tetratricopeptide (TPR) repeat protein
VPAMVDSHRPGLLPEMTAPKNSSVQLRFGAFTANLQSEELWKDGVRIRLQIQPFQILKVFLERPNELITREELQRKVWPSDTFVDFEQGLNKAINKLRDAIGDSADNPQYIETVPKRGYRFIAPVVIDRQPIEPDIRAASQDTTLPAVNAAPPVTRKRGLVIAVTLLVVLGALLAYFSRRTEIDVAGSHSVAVLPLVAQGPVTDYDVADGMTDSIINNLSLIPKLRVISHASVFQYRGQMVDLSSVGQKLGVAALLTGRVERVGTNMTVTLELTATADRRHLWGQQYTRDLRDQAVLPQEIASAVADALRLSVTPANRKRMGNQATADAEAHQLYLKGRYYFFKETPDDVLRARRLFQQAIDRDPTFALAYAALGDSYDWMATEGYQPLGEVAPQAVAAKTRADELDDSLAEIHASLASLEFVQWNWAKAELEFHKAIAINPNYFEAHRLYSIYLRTMKRFPEAIEHAKLCDELNPLLMPAKSHLALTYYYAGQYDAAADQYRMILKDDPGTSSAHAGLSAVLLKLGKEKEAIQEWQESLELAGDSEAAQDLGRNYARGGFRAAKNALLRSELKSLSRVAERGYVSPLEFAYRYALLDDKDGAFQWLEKAYAERSPQLFSLNVDPDYDGLRNDPRFSDLLARIHLAQ